MNKSMMRKAKFKSLADFVEEAAHQSDDLDVKGMLLISAYRLREVEEKEAKKRNRKWYFKGANDPEALAILFFELLLLHDSRKELTDALLNIANEL